ncbi:cation transporter [Anaerosporomusa subterranea]|uniref:Cation transporter n=1 Tax=Anaerosporomusa subterranea TaxID=1794912 RepID=A0A154BNY6_ANASB|nr:cation diffusion facilitator family transporter [Anaerosporomusa subterranea]KYZ75652.1 cation transporter [Anaerosporomusa subterranea]
MPQNSVRQVKKVLWLILAANLLVAVTKIFIGNSIQSTSMTADGYHSLTDGVSNVVGLIGIAFAAKPVDSDHPYGHKKFEFLTGLFIGGMLLVITTNIILEAIAKILEPVTPQFGADTIAALVATLVINVIVSVYEYRQGQRLNSYILIADSLHTRSDIYVSLGVLLTLLGIKLGAPPLLDPIASIIVAGFIAHAALEIIKSTSDILVDRAAVDLVLIESVTMTFSQVKDVHGIRSRGSESALFIDMHIEIDPLMSIEEAHELVHQIEEKLKEEINPTIQALIHTEPYKGLPGITK